MPTPNKYSPTSLKVLKKKKEKIVMVTAYDFTMARLLDGCDIHALLVGDSLGNVMLGYDNTLPVTIDNMIYHSKAVSRAAQKTCVIADMPFLSTSISIETAKINAGRLIQEGHAGAVKIEATQKDIPTIKAIIDMGIPVMGHIGFTPQCVHQIGVSIKGKEKEDAETLSATAMALEAAGCFSIVLELMDEKLSQRISSALSIPTIGIGSGPFCDGQVLVGQDLLGMNPEFNPKFLKKYAALSDTIQEAVNHFANDVQNQAYPGPEHRYTPSTS